MRFVSSVSGLNKRLLLLGPITCLIIYSTSCTGSPLGSELNIGWRNWYCVVCWALLRPIWLSSVAPHYVLGAPAPPVQLNKVFSICLLHAPPPCRNVPLQWLAPNSEWSLFVDSYNPENPFSAIPLSTYM